ncbi:MAG: hypothetical protein LQ346_005467 [Caloplaca aetnensis]|nr:MAG: hypothetical protein LQ346_005467 [Caloplaca aetnensis]
MADSGDLESAKASSFADVKKHYGDSRYSTDLTITSTLRSRYPGYTTTVTPDSTGVLNFATAGQAEAKLDTTADAYALWRTHQPVTDRSTKEGTMQDSVSLGKYDYKWNEHEYIVYVASFFQDYRVHKNTYILFNKSNDEIVDGRSKRADELIAAASQWSVDLHNECWVFDQETWLKNSELWNSVRESSWDDVILDSAMKKTLVEDVKGFFDRKDDYKQFGVPWKRGIIFHGIPGNGKTISIKALMHYLSFRSDPIPTLYVKSLAGCHGPHYAIREIFLKARATAPCLLVFEDLDSLITDQVKSFFLNEVDGLESNDGIMMIGSTNYLDRLDPGIAKRPSRFDRKYHFALPAHDERTKYCDFWRSKLAKNKSIDFPPNLSVVIAEITDGFSFAYLKEIFITSLLVIVAAQRGGHVEKEINGDTGSAEGGNLENNALWRTISKQVETLRTEMEDSRKSAEEAAQNASSGESYPYITFVLPY